MTVETPSKLSEEEIIQLKHLITECQQFDKHLPPIHSSQLNEGGNQSVFIVKDLGNILGFLKIFYFSHGVEVVLLVAPKARRQGIATKLLNTATPILRSKNISNIRFGFSSRECAWLEKLNIQYTETECVLEHNLKQVAHSSNLITYASYRHSQDLIELDVLCFEKRSLTQERVKTLLSLQNYQILIIEIQDKAIAKLHLKFENDIAFIFDVAVHPDNQRQGYADRLVKQALCVAIQRAVKKVQLDVISNNTKALTLYLKNGFTIVQKHHYWNLSI